MNAGALTFPFLGLVVFGAVWASEQIVKAPRTPGPVEVTYWEKWTGFEKDGIEAIVNDFNASQNRIHVKLLTISDIGNKVLMSISGGCPPDIAGLFGPNVAQYADAHSIMPLEDLCRRYGIKKGDYIPAYWNVGWYKGHVYALPSTPASTALHYNVELFRKAGLDPDKPPRTVEELNAMAETMTVLRRDGRIQVSGFLPSEPGWWNWAWPCYFGARLWDGKSRITANEPANVRALEWVQSFSAKYGPAQLQTFRSGFGNFSSPQNAFMEQQVGMELQGVWMANFIGMYAPKMKWAAAPFPYPADRPDLANGTVVDEDIFVIPRGAKHPEEAFEFIAYVQKQKVMEKLCLSHRKNSPLAKVSDDFWARHENPYIRLFDRLARSKNAYATPQIGIWPEYGGELDNAYDNVVLMKKTPKDALDHVTERVQPKLDQYLHRLAMREAAGR